MKKFLVPYIILVVCLLFLPIAHGVTISTSIPGTNANSTSSAPGAFIANFYQFALMIGGILAFGVIVFGGIKYTASAGNPSAQSDAKEWIWGALTGLLLLAGVYLVLNTINPQLVNLNLPTLNAVPATSSNSATSPGSYTTASTCQATSNGGSSGTCSTGNCCNLNGTAICTADSCSNLSNLQCQATANGGTSGACPNDSTGKVQNCCLAEAGDAECTTLDCATFSSQLNASY
jgi:hypothetical protein